MIYYNIDSWISLVFKVNRVILMLVFISILFLYSFNFYFLFFLILIWNTIGIKAAMTAEMNTSVTDTMATTVTITVVNTMTIINSVMIDMNFLIISWWNINRLFYLPVKLILVSNKLYVILFVRAVLRRILHQTAWCSIPFMAGNYKFHKQINGSYCSHE